MHRPQPRRRTARDLLPIIAAVLGARFSGATDALYRDFKAGFVEAVDG